MSRVKEETEWEQRLEMEGMAKKKRDYRRLGQKGLQGAMTEANMRGYSQLI